MSFLVRIWIELGAHWGYLLRSFGFEDWGSLKESLIPTLKYPGSGYISVMISVVSVPVIRIFGLDGLAFASLLLVFFAELISGIWASRVRGEKIESKKLSRFTFKCAYYLLIIAITYLMSESFKVRQKELAVVIFDFMHLFFVVQIVLENVVSVTENYSMITGKPKAHWITILVDKVNGFFK